MSADESSSGKPALGAPAAAAFAMGVANTDPQTAERAREYLQEQTHLTRLEIEELKEKRKLLYTGDKTNALKQVAIARTLDLTAREKAELAAAAARANTVNNQKQAGH